MTSEAMTSAALRARIKAIDEAEARQPERLALARAKAEAARRECLADASNAWDATINVFPGYNTAGEMVGLLGLPDFDVKAIWGARLAYDLLSVLGDGESIKDRLTEYALLINDPAHSWLVCAAALRTIAQYVIPTMLDQVERRAGEWEMRVRLVEAAENAWRTRA